MLKRELNEKVDALLLATKEALQLVYDELNKGQRKKLMKNPIIKDLYERYKVEVDE